jgi:ArsR family transcriptional regulator
LGDPNRINIIDLLRDGEECQCDIIPEVGQSQPTVSRHLRLLEDQGVLSSRKEGVKVIYKINEPKVLTLLDIAKNIV